MKINKDDLPVAMEGPGTIMKNQAGYGGMTVAFNTLPAGTDFTPLLKGLKNDSCHCPHWGYMISGELLIKYDDGTEETLKEGDVFYLPPGHTAIVQKDMQFLDFSPTKELNEVMENVNQRMAELTA